MSRYFLATGETDRKRLEIINRIYNPVSFNFVLESGLKADMQILELGCGFGYTAMWLAKQVPSGMVYAVDSSKDNLAIARENAKQANIHNIEFIHLDAANIKSLNHKFDFFYGRWVIEFCASPISVLEDVHGLLNTGGIFTYETSSFVNNGGFSFIHHSAVQKWHELAALNAQRSGVALNMADRIFHDLKQIGYSNIYARKHQGILTTPEEKSVHRLGLISSRAAWVKNKVMTETEINAFITEFETIENNDDIIIGFYNNILIRGVK